MPGFNEKLTGRYNSQSVSGHFEVGYRNAIGPLVATPFAGIEFGSLYTNAFTETANLGPSVIGLSYAGRNTLSLPTFLGLQLDTKTDLAQDMNLYVAARAAWKHEFDPQRSIESAFIAAPGFDFVIQGAQPPRDSLVAGLDAKLTLNRNMALFGSINGQVGGPGAVFSGSGGLSVTW